MIVEVGEEVAGVWLENRCRMGGLPSAAGGLITNQTTRVPHNQQMNFEAIDCTRSDNRVCYYHGSG